MKYDVQQDTGVRNFIDMQREDFLKALKHELAFDIDLLGSENLHELGWDSMSALSLVALADSKLGVRINGDQLAGCLTVNDLLKVVESGLN